MNFKRFICLALVALFMLTALVACNKKLPDAGNGGESTPAGDNAGDEGLNNNPGNTDPGNTNPGSGNVETESKPNDSDTLSEYDFKGAEYKILTRKATRYEFDSENEKGLETVNTALYQRNEEVKDRFNIKIRLEETNGGWDSDFVSVYQQKATTGWSDVHLTSAHFAMQQLASMQDYCRDMTTVQTEDGAFDMTKEWWSKPFYENCNIEGKFYVAVGDITYTMYEYMQVVFFNEDLVDLYAKDGAGNPVDLYQMVRDGEWNYIVYRDFIKAVPYEESTGIRGLGTQAHAIRGYATAFEAYYTEKDESGAYTKYSFPEIAPAKLATVADTVAEFIKSQNGTTVHFNKQNWGADEGSLNQMFAEGKLMFYEQMMGEVVAFNKLVTDNDFSFGVLPLPMWDDTQLEYHTPIRDTASAISIPKNVENLTMAGVITEALCMYSYQLVRPEYLDTVLGGRYMASDDLQYVLDLVRESFTVDFAHAYSSCLGTPYSTMDALARSAEDKKLESTWETSASKYQTKLDELYAAFGVSAS